MTGPNLLCLNNLTLIENNLKPRTWKKVELIALKLYSNDFFGKNVGCIIYCLESIEKAQETKTLVVNQGWNLEKIEWEAVWQH